MKRICGGTLSVVMAAALSACTVGKDGAPGAPGMPCTGCVDSASLAAGAVTALAIQDGAIDTPHLAAKSVTGAIIADGAILNNHLGAGVVSGPNIAAGGVGTTELANGAVTSAKIGIASTLEWHLDVQTVGVVFSTTDETIMSRFLADLQTLTTMRVMIAVNGATGRGGPTGGAGTLTAMCGATTAYTVALSAGGIRPYTYISPSFTCAQGGNLDINVKAAAATAPVVIRQLEILHGH